MSDERVQHLLRDHARYEWSRTPDLWPSIEAIVKPSARSERRSLPWELGKMAAGAAVVIAIGFILATVFASQQDSLPGIGEDEASELIAPVTSGDALIHRWDEAQERYDLLAVDVQTGEESDRIPPITLGSQPGAMFPAGISSSGSHLATISADESIEVASQGGTMSWPQANRLIIAGIDSDQLVETELPNDGWVVPVIPPMFSPDNETLVLSYQRDEGSTLMLFDVESGELIEERSLGERIAYIDFTSAGDELIVYSQEIRPEPDTSQPALPHVHLFDARNLETRWSESIPDLTSGFQCVDNCEAPLQDRVHASWTPGIVFDRQRQVLYIAHVDQPVIEVVDLDAREIGNLEYEVSPDPPDDEMSGWMRGGVGTLRVSPDGNQLFLLTGGRDVFTLGLTVIDLETRTANVRVSGNVPETGVPAGLVEVTPDGSAALLAGNEFVARYDLEHDQVIEELRGWSVRPSWNLDGEPILLASKRAGTGEPKLGVIDPETLEVVAEWEPNLRDDWALVVGWLLD